MQQPARRPLFKRDRKIEYRDAGEQFLVSELRRFAQRPASKISNVVSLNERAGRPIAKLYSSVENYEAIVKEALNMLVTSPMSFGHDYREGEGTLSSKLYRVSFYLPFNTIASDTVRLIALAF